MSIFTLGGLLGSLAASTTTLRYGQVATLRLSAAMVLAGSTCIGFAGGTSSMLIGRYVSSANCMIIVAHLVLSVFVGIGCGLSTVTVPVFVAQLAPPSMKRSLGISNQISIVIGMLAAQSLSFPFAHPDRWRFVFIAPAMLALIQLAGSLLVNNPVVESQEAPEIEALLETSQEAETLTIKDLFLSREPDVIKGCECNSVTLYLKSFVLMFDVRLRSPCRSCNTDVAAIMRCCTRYKYASTQAICKARG